MIIPVILAGGKGTRLWPLSRQTYPKQFLDLTDPTFSLFQQTIRRVLRIPEVKAPLVICNQENRFMVADQLKQIHQQGRVMLEPCGRNTAPAIALAALYALNEGENDPLLVLPSDHSFPGEDAFIEAVRKAEKLANNGYVVTFGIQPTHPETGYGYIKAGPPLAAVGKAWSVDKFVEKPDAQKAQAYLEQGGYYWNSGMFVLTPRVYLAELKQHAPDIYDSVLRAFENRNTDLDFIRIDEQAFQETRSESIDYAVMEPTQKAAVVPLSEPWSDVGSWASLAEVLPKDENLNVVQGEVRLKDTENCLIRAESRLVAAVGLTDTVIVETADAVLVADKSHSQSVQHIVKQLTDEGRSEVIHHKRVYRPWGWYESICDSERFQVKRILVNPGHKLSLQMHHHRAEHWVVVKGTAEITRGDEVVLLTEDQSTYIPLGVNHRLSNPGKIPLEIIEVQTGSYLGEDDIVRFEDSYGR